MQPVSDRIWYLPFSLYRTSHGMTTSRSMLVAAVGTISFFLWPGNIVWCIPTTSSLCTHQSIDPYLTSVSSQVIIVLQWTCVFSSEGFIQLQVRERDCWILWWLCFFFFFLWNLHNTCQPYAFPPTAEERRFLSALTVGRPFVDGHS